MAQYERIGEGVETAPPPPERRNDRVKSIDFDHESAGAELIGSASSQEEGRPRWTELKVWYLRTPPQKGRPWLSEVYGMSTVPGERPRVQRLNVGSLERALKLFADSDIGVIASEEAREWHEEHVVGRIGEVTIVNPDWDNALREAGVSVTVQGHRDDPAMRSVLVGQGVFDHLREHPSVREVIDLEDDPAALEWLYGETDGGKATFASMLAKDFDLAPRTVTTALANGTEIRIPLRLALRFFDRDAFRAWRQREKADV